MSVTASAPSSFTYNDAHGAHVHLSYQVHTPSDPVSAARTPLVLVHGWCGRKEQWYGLASRLAAHRPVLAFDTRGLSVDGPIPNRLFTDQSPYPDIRPSPSTPFSELVKAGLELSPQLSTFDLADDAAALARHVFPAHAALHWLGYSMGGAVLQCLAIAHPTQIRSLAITSTLGVCARQSVLEFMRKELPVPPASHAPETEEEKAAMAAVGAFLMTADPKVMLSPHTLATRPEALQELVGPMMAAPLSLHTYAQHLNTSLAHDVADRLQGAVPAEVPVVLMAGEDDCASLEGGVKAVKRAWPHARLVTWPQVGHVTMLEAQDALLHEVEDNIARVEK